MRHPAPKAKRPRPAQRGSLVVYLALALVAFGLLAIIGVTRFGASVGSVLAPNCATAARYMAEAGLRYAAARLRNCATATDLSATVGDMNGHGLYVMDAQRGLGFTLHISYDANYTATVTSTGRGCAIIAPVTATASASNINLPVVASASAVIDFSNLADDFMRTTALQSATNPISVNNSAKTISFGTLSGTHNAAAIWYAGNATIGCVDGNCTMDNGLRAYFTVQWNSASVADGLVFGIMSAATNAVTSVGGDADMGELMGWAGPGSSGKGIQPPKIGLEFDTWYNDCAANPCQIASRCDPDSSANLDHLAYVFWGSNAYYSYSGRQGTTYDDNQHGAGSGGPTEPVSSNDPDGAGSGLYGMYYKSPANWLRGGTKYYMRMELTRLTTPSSGSTYAYGMKTWVTAATPSDAFKSVLADYDASANPPAMQQIIFLNSTYHQQLNKIIFGWSEATGLYAQNITVGDFALAFKTAQPVYGAAPAGYTACWPMYDNVGTTVTNTVAGSPNGSISGTARWVPGIVNNNGAALYFNGSTAMSAASATALALTGTGGVSLWFKPYAANTGKWLLRKGAVSASRTVYYNGSTATGPSSDTSEAYGFYIDSGGKLRFRLRWGTGASDIIEAASTTTPAQGKWCHAAATWNGSSLTLYINGVAERTVTTGHSAQASADALAVGANPTVTTVTTYTNRSNTRYTTSTVTTYDGFTGIIDEVYLYKALLSQANVTALATGTP